MIKGSDIIKPLRLLHLRTSQLIRPYRRAKPAGADRFNSFLGLTFTECSFLRIELIPQPVEIPGSMEQPQAIREHYHAPVEIRPGTP